MRSRRRARPLLGTIVEIGIGGDADVSDAVFERAFEGLALIENLMSFQDPGSELSQFNAATDEIELHWRTADVLRRALAVGRRSGELFNCTVGGSLVKQGVLPDHGGADAADSGNSDDVMLAGRKAKRLRPVCVTLDGIAKGYAVDYAVTLLQRSGVTAGWVNAGGDLRVFGDLRLCVDRRDHAGDKTGLGSLHDAAVATSSSVTVPDAERPAWMVRGDGGAVDAGTWSVLAPRAWLADALTKVACLASPADRSATVASLGGHLVTAQ